MANDIPHRQNEEQALRLLAAQRRTYGWGKTTQAVQLVLVVIVPSTLLVVEHFVPSLKIWAAFAGLTISVVDVGILETIKTSLRRRAAAIQELFDCKVLELEWPARKTKPDLEDVHGAASGYPRDVLKDWYPREVGEMPLHVGRIICQRSNCWWDSKLRRRYRAAVLCLFAILSVGVVFAALLKNLTISDFVVSLLAPVLPILLWSIREAKQQSEASSRVDHLKSFGDELWEGMLQGKITSDAAAVQSRAFQDDIYEHRRQSPMIFDWFYVLLRKKFESQMTASAADMVREAHEKGL